MDGTHCSRTIYAAAVIPLLLLYSCQTSHAEAANQSPHLDQAQLVVTGALSLRRGASQTVEMGHRGPIVWVDLPLCSPLRGSRVVLELRAASGGGPRATSVVTFTHSYADCSWYRFVFRHPIQAAVGEIITLTATAPRRTAALWGEDGRGGDPYPGGSGLWMNRAINDFAFRIYVRS